MADESNEAQAQVDGVSDAQTFTQEQVDEIVKQRQARAVEQAVKAEREKHQQQQMSQGSQNMAMDSQAQQMQGIGGQQNVDVDKIRQEIQQSIEQKQKEEQEEQRKREYQARANELTNQYYSKMAKGKEQFEDFDEVINDFNPEAFPRVVFLATELESTPALMYELAKNPNKLAYVDYLARSSPDLAKKELKKLEGSIRKNAEAKDSYSKAKAPLDRIQPSPEAGADSNVSTVSDYRKLDWLRG